jgi:hypothetical protein
MQSFGSKQIVAVHSFCHGNDLENNLALVSANGLDTVRPSHLVVHDIVLHVGDQYAWRNQQPSCSDELKQIVYA